MHSGSEHIDTHIERVLTKRGGKRQRDYIEYGGDRMSDSSLCNFWGKQWGLKGYSDVYFMEEAKRSCKDHGKYSHASIAKLASMASSSKNYPRAFRRAVKTCESGPQISIVQTVVVDVKHPSGVPKEIPHDFPVIFPHDHFSWMHKTFPDLLEMFLTGGKSEQQSQNFWDSVPRNDPVWSHERLFYGMDMSGACPAISHTDIVPVALGD